MNRWYCVGIVVIHDDPPGEWDSGAGSDCSEGASEVEEKEEEGRDKSISEVKQVTREEEETDRRVIKPDICAISQLLNFDEVRKRWCCAALNLCVKWFVLLKTLNICTPLERQLCPFACVYARCHLPRNNREKTEPFFRRRRMTCQVRRRRGRRRSGGGGAPWSRTSPRRAGLASPGATV